MSRSGLNVDWDIKLKDTPYSSPQEICRAAYDMVRTYEQAGVLLGVDKSTIEYWCKTDKPYQGGQRQTTKDILAMPEERRSAMSVKQIAEELGMSYSTAYHVIKRHGLKVAREPRKVSASKSKRKRERRFECFKEANRKCQMYGDLNGKVCQVCGKPLRGNWMRRCPVCRNRLLHDVDTGGYGEMDFGIGRASLKW